jgi:hypothetical protein
MGNDNRGNKAKMGASRIFLEIHWEEEEAINKRTAKLVESALIVRLAMFTTGQRGQSHSSAAGANHAKA